ncbi:MAG: DUF1761 domain-containing protein [Candidatus Aminicenantales bacterium]
MVFNLQEGFYLWAILASAAASMVLGFVWYGPLFGKAWGRYSGWTAEKIKTVSGKSMGLAYGLAFAAAVVSSLALTVLSRSLGATTAMGGLMIGLLAGVGLVAMAMATNFLFERRPLGFWLIVAGYEVVFMAVAGVIVTIWR